MGPEEPEENITYMDASLYKAATITFAAAITVPGGLKSEKGSEQGTPFLIDEAAFKVFVVTNALAFILSISALSIHFGNLDILLSNFNIWACEEAKVSRSSPSHACSCKEKKRDQTVVLLPGDVCILNQKSWPPCSSCRFMHARIFYT
ncbi:uncharacterized protein LOC128291535 isoform X3 [Gossypium arboreum]|uniref:uncharacterized protein LOC128291535 isoform X3 n=1 Tax=Gossypium arboreum TaxID=29729 RepID=UPI0022F165B0|nr:uncharacterized protein LOC128291535 isoform X3 [Gossypium arboreum]